MLLDAEERGERGDDVRFVAERSQFDEPDAVRIAGDGPACGFEREPRLAHAARTEQGDDAILTEQVVDAREIVVATDQRGNCDGQVVGGRQA